MLSAKQVTPGQTGEIEVSVKTEALTAVNKTIKVTSNDPQNNEVDLRLTATVQPEFALSERVMFFGSVPRGKEEIREIVVTISPDRAVKIVSAGSTDDSFSARLEPVEGSEGKKVRLVGVLKADAKEGYHFGMLVIKTSSAFTPELKVPVRGTIVAPQNY